MTWEDVFDQCEMFRNRSNEDYLAWFAGFAEQSGWTPPHNVEFGNQNVGFVKLVWEDGNDLFWIILTEDGEAYKSIDGSLWLASIDGWEHYKASQLMGSDNATDCQDR